MTWDNRDWPFQNPNILQKMLWHVSASTYPIAILKRRLGFLSRRDRNRVEAKAERIAELLEEIDIIIQIEAEKQKDPWK